VRILAFDTALGACSAAVWADGLVLARAFEPRSRGHAEALLPMIEAVLAEAGLRLDALDRLAVTVGPGSFAGTRVGLAAARGLALATGLPLVGVTTLEAVAFDLPAPAGSAIVSANDRCSPSIAAKKPWRPSSACALAVSPRRARPAASIALRAANPACSGFTIVPKFSFRPDASDAAIANACAVAASSSPRMRDTAAVAPTVPIVAVQCHPRS